MVLEKCFSYQMLERSQKIYDAVHGFIRFNGLEKHIIDSEPFQRLHSIHQLGIAFLVYPGATHTRFEHSLGTMYLSTQIFERITAKGFHFADEEYWLQVVRFAALCHDLGHLPFSHDAEKELLGKNGHEEWTLKAIAYLRPIWQEASLYFPGKKMEEDVLKMAIGEKKLLEMGVSLEFSSLERVLSQIVTADFFGADRIDYLLRDAQCTGVSHGCFDYQQLIEMLCVRSVEGRLEICIEENGVQSCEALLLARHFMHQRVYKYISVKIYKFHLSRFMKGFFLSQPFLESLESYLTLTDHEIFTELRKAAKEKDHPGRSDALALLNRADRFKAILLEEGSLLPSFLETAGIDQDSFFIEPESSTNKEGQASFFVATQSSDVVLSTEFSQIALSPKKERWIYLSSEWEKKALLIGSYKK